MKLGIIKDFKNQHQILVDACKELNVDYEIVDIISNNWISNIIKSNCDGFMVKPPGRRDAWKRMYDEKLYFINKTMGKPIYPSYEEIFLYENKRVMSYWYDINRVKTPKTWVFYDKNEALEFVESYEDYPLLFKSNIASGGIGIEKLKNKREAKRLVNKIFTHFNFYSKGYTKWNKKMESHTRCLMINNMIIYYFKRLLM